MKKLLSLSSLLLVFCGSFGCSAEGPAPSPANTPTSRPVESGAEAAPESAAPTGKRPDDKDPKPVVKIVTSLGDITVELDREKAPITVKNFLEYVDKGHYDGTIFHRVIKTFMIQGGGYTADQTKKPTGTPIPLEAGKISNVRGTIAMARTGLPDSATAQFFINVVDNTRLDPAPGQEKSTGYAAFGAVIEGMDVVDKIRNVPVENQGGAFKNAPVEPVIIKSIRRL